MGELKQTPAMGKNIDTPLPKEVGDDITMLLTSLSINNMKTQCLWKKAAPDADLSLQESQSLADIENNTNSTITFAIITTIDSI